MNDIEDRSVLDLFAGSGALGIEALSRGASRAIFVEIAHKQAVTIKNNLISLSLRMEILEMDYLKACRHLSETKSSFDLIFADPPYEKVMPRAVIDAVLEYNLLAPEGFLIIEHKSGLDINDRRMNVLKNRKFGQTEVTFYAVK